MADHRITDFVDQAAIDSLKTLKSEISAVKDAYVETAKELIKGLNLKVDSIEQLEKLTKLVADQQQRAAESTQRLTAATEDYRQGVANTSNTISRQLMEQEKLNEKTRAAYSRQKDVKDILTQAVSSYGDMTKRLAEITIAQAKLNDAKAREKKEYEGGLKTYDQYSSALQDIIIQQQALAAEKSQLEAYTRSEAKENANASSSYNAMSQELLRLKKAYKELDEEGRNTEIGKNMLAEIKELGAHLKDLDGSMGDFQRNVGDYAIANGSVKKELKDLVLEIANLSVAYRNLSEEEKNSAEGQAMKDKIQQMTERAGELRDAVADTTEAIKNAASDTRGFDQISGGIQLIIDGFGLATGAATMLGISEDDLVEIQTKLQAAIVASNAITKVQTALQKQSAVMQGVAIIQTKAAMMATKMKTAAESESIVVSKAATIAQAAFNAVAYANPYVLLAMAIVTVVGALAIFVSSSNAAKEAQESLNKEIERTNKGIQRISDECDFNVGIAKACGESEEAIRKMRLEAARAANDLAYLNLQRVSHDPNHTKEQYDEAVRLEAETYQKVKDILDEGTFAYLKSLNDKEKAEEAAAKKRKQQADDEYKRAKTAQALEKDMLKLRQTSLRLQLQAAVEFSDEWVEIMERIAQTNYSVKVFDIKDQLAAALKDVENSYKVGKISAEEHNRAIEELTKNANDHLVALQMELSDELAEIQTKVAKHRYEIEKANIANRLAVVKKGSEEEYELKLQQLELEYRMEVEEAIKTGVDTLAIREKYEKLKLDLATEHTNDRIKLIQDEASAEMVVDDFNFNDRLKKMKERYAQELSEAGNNEKERAQITKKYEAEVAEATEEYSKERARGNVEMCKKMLELEDLTSEERAGLEAELASAEIDYENAVADAAIAANKRKVQSDKESTEERIKNAQQWLQVASQGLNAIADLTKAVFDGKIQRIEAELEATSEATEKETGMITELVEKKVISEEEGEARKRAAEAKSAQKTAELERKKQQMQQKQAMWDKANSLAQAGIATALAITQALPNFVLAAIVGAMGAIQVATILATPIPKYAKGTDFHPGGLAIVGDAGKQEVVLVGDSLYLTPSTPTMIDMPKGAAVYPDVDNFITETALTPVNTEPSVIVHNDYQRLERRMQENNDLLKRLLKETHSANYNQAYQAYKNSRI